ncbi:MAG: L-threonylcarbamoyladenylate synthase [Bdellovibrionota bacterium]
MLTVQQQINLAVEQLQNNEVVAMPTETVYGLAARIDSEVAIKKIFSIKQRPFFDPLIVHVSSVDQAKKCVTEWNELSDFLAKTFWPGPLTLVLPKSDLISDLITSGLPSVALRWPQHPIAQELINRVGVPLAAPSANKFGRTSPTKAQHVKEEFSDSVLVIEGDSSSVGIESTVLSVKKQNNIYELAILRKGSILKSQITEVLSRQSFKYQWQEVIDKIESPGHMKHHYMPSIPLVVCRDAKLKLSELSGLLNKKLNELPDEIEGVKIIKPKSDIKKIEFLKLSSDPTQAARELYSQLRAASLRSPDVLCFIQTSAHTGEMWESVFDRLYKAASLILD